MGLDIALGAIILLGALRGWLKGFAGQAVRLMGLVSCVYLAHPVREQARPYIMAKMPAIEPGLLDRMLWWVAAVVSYLVLVGLVSLAIQLMKTPTEPGMIPSRRGDRLGGLLLGAAKAAVVAAFLAAGVQKYGGDLSRNIAWLERQIDGSKALAWTQQYQPVPRLWATAPVQSLVQEIQRNGLKRATETDGEKKLAEQASSVAESVNRPPRLGLPPAEAPELEATPGGSELGDDVLRELEKIKQDLRAQGAPR